MDERAGPDEHLVQVSLADTQWLPGVQHRPVGAGPHPYLIMLHGASGCAAENHGLFAHFGRVAAASGIGVLRFDHRGRGDLSRIEDGRQDTFFTTRLADLQACERFLLERQDVDRDRLGLVGFSAGALVVLAAVSRGRSTPRALALWSPSSTVVPFQPSKECERVAGGYDFRGYFYSDRTQAEFVQSQPVRELRKYAGPVLLIVGDLDPPRVRSLGHFRDELGGQCEYELIPDCDHDFRNARATQRVASRTVEFMSRKLSSGHQ